MAGKNSKPGNRYEPTAAERRRLPMQPGQLKVSGDGIFFTVQGEGASIGSPAVFLRLHHCNLACHWCDTKYTWDKNTREFWQEAEDWPPGMVAARVKAFNCKRLVITGGEPLLQMPALENLLKRLPGWTVEIETNGSIVPSAQLSKRCYFNVSPKLSNSRMTEARRIKVEALSRFVSHPRSSFKFVAQGPEDLREIERLVYRFSIPPERIIVMPEGRDNRTLKSRMLALADSVKEKGWRLLPRLHVFLWEQQRGV